MKRSEYDLPIRTVIAYAIFASLWILLSDHALLLLSPDPLTLAWLETAKGWLFVAVSSLLLFTVLTRYAVSRRRAEEERARLIAAIEAAAEVIVVTNPQGEIQYVNPAFEAVTGYRRDEAIGRNPRILKSGETDSSVYQELWGTISDGRTWRGRLTNRRKDGSLYTEEVAISPVFDDRGTIVNYVAAKRDITIELGLEQQLLQSQKLESLGTLATGISHDFNNILAIILGYSTMIEERVPSAEQVKQRFTAIAQAAERGANLVRQLLAFGRKSEKRLTILDINRLVAEIEGVLRETFPRNLRIEVQAAEELPRIRADADQIHQVLLNLCINARDSMPSGGLLEICTHLAAPGANRRSGDPGSSWVAVEVRDTGHGMDEATRQRVFEPFFTTKIAGSGTGLGLSVVYGIIRNHGGEIEVESQVDAGSRFIVYLPVAD